jgi:beta-phosphoglucomutase-like phosphatase (HAD superfamily)
MNFGPAHSNALGSTHGANSETLVRPRSKTVGLMFDLDGISLDTVLPQTEVMRRVIREQFDIQLVSEDLSWTVGLSGEDTIDGFNERFGSCSLRSPNRLLPDESIGRHILRRLLEIRRPQEQALIEVAPMPGLPQLLDFADAADLPRSSTTSRPESQALELLKGTNLQHRFDVVVGRDSLGVSKPKPAPDVVIQSALQLRIKIEDSWLLDDAKVGIDAGNAAGAKTLYVADPRVGAPCSAARRAATHTVHSLEEATSFLQREIGI